MLHISLDINSVGATTARQLVRAGAPSLLQIDAVTLEARWTPVPGATSYDLRWKALSDPAWTLVSGASSPHRIADPLPETTYAAEVRAIVGAAVGSWSETAVLFTNATAASMSITSTTFATSPDPFTFGNARFSAAGAGRTFDLTVASGTGAIVVAAAMATVEAAFGDPFEAHWITGGVEYPMTPLGMFGGSNRGEVGVFLLNSPVAGAGVIRVRAGATRFYTSTAQIWALSGPAYVADYGGKVAASATDMSLTLVLPDGESVLLGGAVGTATGSSGPTLTLANVADTLDGGTLTGDNPYAHVRSGFWSRTVASGTATDTGVTFSPAAQSSVARVVLTPLAGGAPTATLNNVPTTWPPDATIEFIANGYRATADASPTQLYASEVVDVTPGAMLRLTGTIKAPAGTYPLVRVGRNADLTPPANGSIEGYLTDFVTEKVIVGDGTAQSFTMDFRAPQDRLYFGFRLPNAADGTEIEVTNLALAPQPQTVAAPTLVNGVPEGGTVLTNTVEHDGVVFSIQKADGSPVKVGRYFSDGSYWALNDEPVTNPVRLTKARIVGRPDAESIMPYPGYRAYGEVPGQSLPEYDLTGLPFNGAALDSIYDKNGIYAIIAEGRYSGATNGYDSDQNIQPYKTGKPVVFDKTVGIDASIEPDRISAPTASIYIQEVGNENIPSVGQQHGVNYWVTLTVVTTEPSAGAFRPPLTQRGARNVPIEWSDVAAQVAALPNLTTPAEALPYMVDAEDALVRLSSPPVADGSSLGQSGRGRARRFGGCYARETLRSMNRMAAGLIYDYWPPEKKAQIAAMVIQHGLDYAGRAADRPGLAQYPAGSNTGVMLHSVKFASAMAPLNTLLSTAALLDGYWSDLQQRVRVPQFVIDTGAAQLVGHNGLRKSPPQRRPQAALGEGIWTQGEIEERPGSMTSGRNPAYVAGNVAAPYWGQDVVISFIFDAVLARLDAPTDPLYTEVTDKDYFRKIYADARFLAAGGFGEITDPLAKIVYEGQRSDGRPISASMWGLELVDAETQVAKPDGLSMLRPLYPGVANATWIDLLNDEFMGGVFTYPEALQYEVLTTTETFGEMTTTAGVNATTLIPGVTLNPSTGIISADGTQVATSLRWFRVRAWNSYGEAFAVIALEVAENHLRSVYTSYSYCQPRTGTKGVVLWDPTGAGGVPTDPDSVILRFRANLQGAGGADGTLYWVAVEDPAYKNISRPNPTPRVQDAPSAAQVKAGQRADGTSATFSGSIPVTGNGWSGEFGLTNADLTAWGTIYDFSVYWEPATGAAPPVVLQSVGTQFN